MINNLLVALLLTSAPSSASYRAEHLAPSINKAEHTPTVLSPPQTLFDDDALTITHVVFQNGALVDKYRAWTMTGTVPQVTNEWPNGAGPFSASNYYSIAAASAGAFDLAGGTWTFCIAFKPASVAPNQVLMAKGAAGTDGFYTQITTGGTFFYGVSTPTAIAPNLGGVQANLVNVACMGRNPTHVFARLNRHPVIPASAAGAMVAATASDMILGRYGPGGQDFNGTIYEMWATTTPASQPLLTEITDRAFLRLNRAPPVP